MIPYTVDRRADTQVTNVTLGVWLFLASEVMLFGALFSSYALLRASAPDWPSGRDFLELPIGALNTVVLILLTSFVWRARTVAPQTSAKLLWLSSGLGVIFLVNKAIEYSSEIGQGLLPSTNLFLALYFTLTGFHALHVIGGLVANVWAATGRTRVGDAMTAGRVQALALYWVFVDVVWLIIFLLFYAS
jgi:heme/copper-type cytochrome/quinol oxidase subunit 3